MAFATLLGMKPLLVMIGLLFSALGCAYGQWQMEDSTSKAGLRGIDAVNGAVAWASGTDGTVLRTEDSGYVWQRCAIPQGAEHLDFRAIQGFDNNTALVMSSGKGDLSRIYKTTDGCHSWKLVFTNPDVDGFWDAMRFNARGSNFGALIGDPVDGRFALFYTKDAGEHWTRWGRIASRDGESLFAASNSAWEFVPGGAVFVTGGQSGSRAIREKAKAWSLHAKLLYGGIPLGAGESSGAFSVATSTVDGALHFVAVGGDYTKPERREQTAAWSDDGVNWTESQTKPGGYRSAVAYDAATKAWICVGPNGTDFSTDGGRNWRPLKPAKHDESDADRGWNALSLPFVVGVKGRIGKLEISNIAD